MQLSTVKISNILSFPYVENLTSIEGIKFHNEEKGVINILIGPNGSGKSNLLDIINAVWKYGITTNYQLNYNQDNTPTITENNRIHHGLTPYRGQESKISHVYLSILLSQDDYNNLYFLLNNIDTINNIICNYSTLDLQFQPIDKELLSETNKIPLYLTITKDNLLILEPTKNPAFQFIYQYLTHFELIQLCIDLYSTHRPHKTRERYPLRSTFALITSEHRSISTVKPIRFLCKKLEYLTRIDGSLQHDRESLLHAFFLEAVNTTLETYTGLRILTTDHLSESNFLFKNKDGIVFSFHELSSGEQSLLALILLMYSHDLHNGFLIIDEPELHLHPQAQKLFLQLIQEMTTKQSMQCIISTHSPILINEHNINNVFRCSKIQGSTHINTPRYQFDDEESTLLQLLKFDHIAKIFFVDKIILVEGETDMYFLTHYLDHLKTQTQRKNIITNYEIITIGGKGGVKRRHRFLQKFGTDVSYIGDRDNTIEYGIVSHEQLSHNKKSHRDSSMKGSKYASVIGSLQRHNPALYTHIISRIRDLYQKNIYLLQQGDLEAYLGLQSKGIDDTVWFCTHRFDEWVTNPQYREKQSELEDIIGRIFSQKG